MIVARVKCYVIDVLYWWWLAIARDSTNFGVNCNNTYITRVVGPRNVTSTAKRGKEGPDRGPLDSPTKLLSFFGRKVISLPFSSKLVAERYPTWTPCPYLPLVTVRHVLRFCYNHNIHTYSSSSTNFIHFHWRFTSIIEYLLESLKHLMNMAS